MWNPTTNQNQPFIVTSTYQKGHEPHWRKDQEIMAPGIICFLSLFSTKHVVEIFMALSQTIDVCYENNIYVDLLHISITWSAFLLPRCCRSIWWSNAINLSRYCNQHKLMSNRRKWSTRTSWHAFISGYICCRIYMITIEKHIDFLYLYFFFLYIYLYQFLHNFPDISFWCQNDHTQMYGRKPKWFICRWSWGQELMTLLNGKAMALTWSFL